MDIDPEAAHLAVAARVAWHGPLGTARCKRCGGPLPAQGYPYAHCADCLMYLAVAGQRPAEPGVWTVPAAAADRLVEAVKAHFAWGRTRLALPSSARRCADCDRELPPAAAYPHRRCPDHLARAAVAGFAPGPAA
jgi:DNA-directed RNA polymerase subunit RPC12/RpoP